MNHSLRSAVVPEPAEDVIVALRDVLTTNPPDNIPATLSALTRAANVLQDNEMLAAIAEVNELDTNNPAFIEKYCDLLIVAGDVFSFLELQSQTITDQIQRHQEMLGIAESSQPEGKVC